MKFEISFELKLFEDCEKYATHPQQFHMIDFNLLERMAFGHRFENTDEKLRPFNTPSCVYKSQGKELKKKSNNW